METITDPSFTAALTFLLPAIIGAASALVADAAKYINTPLWDTKVFINTNLKPFGLTLAVTFIVYFILGFAPIALPILEALAGSSLGEITALGLFGFAQGIVKNIMKPKESAPDGDL